MPKILIFITLVVFSIILFIGLIRQISNALQASSRLDQAVEEINKLQDQNNKLKKSYAETKSYDFIEEVARNKLNLSKPNETVVFIQQSDLEKVLAAEQPKIEPKLTNWQGWIRLFF